ncbi:MAG: MFS transporter [Ruminococcaceae bacterium]|nr:MFS transporter [Oscillospiraceae bacterium]
MKNTKRIKSACYCMNVAMAIIGNLPPILFLTFHNKFDISFSLLGLLVLLNFSSQLIVDLIFSFFSHKFNIPLTVKLTPLISVLGLVIFVAWPTFFPSSAYVGFVLGTIVFSASSGLAEVLLSAVIAALPSDNPDRDMSMLHSIYAWGAVGVISLGSIFLLIFSSDSWQILTLIFTLVPLLSFVLYLGAELPELNVGAKADASTTIYKSKVMWLSVIAIFLGGAIECTMAQWASSFTEVALGIPKIYGDVFGAALFALTLGLGRTLYTKYGKRIEGILIAGVIAAAVCYLTAVFSSSPIIGLIACALTGFAASMLWPGNLIAVSERIPTGGVVMFALMAAGGDLGASVGPELVGVITDVVALSPRMLEIATDLGMSGEQLGMKCGLLIGAVFAIIAIPLYISIFRSKKEKE